MIAQVIEERLHAELEAGRLARGAQVAVFADGQLRAEVAVGSDHHGDPFAPDTASCLAFQRINVIIATAPGPNRDSMVADACRHVDRVVAEAVQWLRPLPLNNA